MASHSSILTWRIPWTEKPGGLQSVGSQRVRHDWATNIHTHIGLPRWLSGKESACQCRRYRRCGFDPWVGKSPWRRKWQPIPVFLPGKIPWTEEPGRLQSIGPQRVGHGWADACVRARAHTHTHSVSELECMLELLCSDLMSTRWHCKKCFQQCCGFLWESCISYSAKALLTGEPWGPVLLNDWPPNFCSELSVLMHPSIHHCWEGDREWFITNDSSLMKITSD